MPSCAPSAPGLETTGYEIGPDDVTEAMSWPGIIGLGEMMNFPGLINGDDVVLDKNLMAKLKDRFGNKISTVTGRGKFAFSYSMKNFLNDLDIEHSVFLEDRSLSLAKPNPESLIESISGINSKCSLYVGDSMEDLLMVEKCKEKGLDVSFCGIYGSSDEPELKFELFRNPPRKFSGGIFSEENSSEKIPPRKFTAIY